MNLSFNTTLAPSKPTGRAVCINRAQHLSAVLNTRIAKVGLKHRRAAVLGMIALPV